MIERNAKLTQINQSVFDIRVISNALNDFYKKHGENCHIKISKAKASKTYKQIKFIHSLVTALSISPCHSYKVTSLDQFKLKLKRDFGVSSVFDIGGEKLIYIKSLADYSKYELSEFIENVVDFCNVCMAYPEDKRIVKIIDGARKEKLI